VQVTVINDELGSELHQACVILRLGDPTSLE